MYKNCVITFLGSIKSLLPEQNVVYLKVKQIVLSLYDRSFSIESLIFQCTFVWIQRRYDLFVSKLRHLRL